MTNEKFSGAICGGNHSSKIWKKRELIKHFSEKPCIDCYCGVPFNAGKSKVWKNKLLDD